MEASYGIGVQNRYALFLEDGEDDIVDPYSLMNVPGIAVDHQSGNSGDSMKKVSTTTSSSANAKLSSNQQKGHHHHQQQQSMKSSSSSANVTNKQSPGTLTESKQQNVMANNQKSDSGKF